MTNNETLLKVQDLLIQVESLQPQTLGIDVTCISDLIDEINQKLTD